MTTSAIVLFTSGKNMIGYIHVGNISAQNLEPKNILLTGEVQAIFDGKYYI